MSGDIFLLDTNIVVPILNQNPELEKHIRRLTLYIPVIVLGELYYGAQKSDQTAANRARIEVFKTRCTILLCDETTAGIYGEIKEKLTAKGRPLPENDIWIAAIARQHSLTLVTRDDHFQQIDNLQTEKW
jgi:tRNA(fMet)-specific endonuclease VapC